MQKVAAAVPRCDGRITRKVVGEYVPSKADRCRLCNGCHVLVIKKVIIRAMPPTLPNSEEK